MKKKQESNPRPNIFGKYAYLATWAASLLLLEHVGIVDLNNAAQGRSQKFTKGDKTGSLWGRQIPSRVQGQPQKLDTYTECITVF